MGSRYLADLNYVLAQTDGIQLRNSAMRAELLNRGEVSAVWVETCRSA